MKINQSNRWLLLCIRNEAKQCLALNKQYHTLVVLCFTSLLSNGPVYNRCHICAVWIIFNWIGVSFIFSIQRYNKQIYEIPYSDFHRQSRNVEIWIFGEIFETDMMWRHRTTADAIMKCITKTSNSMRIRLKKDTTVRCVAVRKIIQFGVHMN